MTVDDAANGLYGTCSMTCVDSVLAAIHAAPQHDKAKNAANSASEIQIVDTHESLKTFVNIGFLASESQLTGHY